MLPIQRQIVARRVGFRVQGLGGFRLQGLGYRVNPVMGTTMDY